ncbi:fimbrial protein [Acinetobacter silvestris]|uniref:Fimbrial-type adhesion domain-containing protein n=1 Tax=Acinetobacter silvestris TaxID=1977882 RepID=A0A1Y3CIU8_9GAMM|nr:fimbrial protein [Acinetobacter silvestris]OTG65073.1 hypothetical protein B9T28_09775 [Acinetobacter silvestris]
MRNPLLLSSFVLFFSLDVNACNTTGTENPNFTLSNLGNFKTNANNQRVTATTTPDRYGTIINNCNNTGSNSFQINGTSLSTSDIINLNSRTYYRINTPQNPVAASPAQIYIAFSVKDNQDSATLYPVDSSTTSYSLFTGSSSTRGMRLEQVGVLIRGTNLTPGTYSISNIILGTYTATGTKTSSKNINISNLSYTISPSTCVVDSSNITLPSMRSSDFSSINQIGGTTSFSITANCPNDAVNTSYSAAITDNFSSASNMNGILTNSISASSGGSNIKIKLIDPSNNVIPIGPLLLNNKFTFGMLNNSKTVTKSLQAAYYAETIPVTVGLVKSVAVLNLIYD